MMAVKGMPMGDAAKAIVGLYERHAAAFDRLRGRGGMEMGWLDRFAALLAPGGRVLDIGCGMGEPMARELIERGFRVTGVDSSARMIGMCRERFPAARWEVRDMRGLALGERFDGVLAWDSFFHLTRDEQRAMLEVFAAHAKPGTALMFTSGPADGEAVGVFEGEPLYHASLAPEEYRKLLAGVGFAVVRHVAEDPECGGHTVWLAQRTTGGAAGRI